MLNLYICFDPRLFFPCTLRTTGDSTLGWAGFFGMRIGSVRLSWDLLVSRSQSCPQAVGKGRGPGPAIKWNA